MYENKLKILAVDTAYNIASAAVLEGNTLLGEYTLNNGKNHSQKLLPMIKELMDGLDLCADDIDIFAVSNGPGSFTGLRIGVTTVKAMAFAAGKPVVGIPTLDALAYNVCIADSLLCPLMDARNNQVYTAVYNSSNGSMARITDYMGIPVAELINKLKDMDGSIIFSGDGAVIHRELLMHDLKERCIFAAGNTMLNRASSVACLALDRVEKGELDDPFTLVPYYLRKSQAEREKEKMQQKAFFPSDGRD